MARGSGARRLLQGKESGGNYPRGVWAWVWMEPPIFFSSSSVIYTWALVLGPTIKEEGWVFPRWDGVVS